MKPNQKFLSLRDAFLPPFPVLNKTLFNKTLLYSYEMTPIVNLALHINAYLALNQTKSQNYKPNLPEATSKIVCNPHSNF